jgi:hypothetical protein
VANNKGLAMKKINVWFVIAKEDSKNPYGYLQVNPKGTYYKTFFEANIDMACLKHNYVEKLVVLKRTCQVVDGKEEPKFSMKGGLPQDVKNKIILERLKAGWTCKKNPRSGEYHIWKPPTLDKV